MGQRWVSAIAFSRGNTGFHFRVGGGAILGKGLPMGLDFSASSKRGLLPWFYVGGGVAF